jgi:hypothetical protein
VTARWLTDEWFDLAGAEGADLSGPPTLAGTVVVEVTGAVGGDVVGHATFAGGRLVGCGPGAVPGPDLTLTLTDDDARAVTAGELDPSVAFMQGRMKVAGAMAPLLDLLALAGTDGARQRRDRVAAQTDF